MVFQAQCHYKANFQRGKKNTSVIEALKSFKKRPQDLHDKVMLGSGKLFVILQFVCHPANCVPSFKLCAILERVGIANRNTSLIRTQ